MINSLRAQGHEEPIFVLDAGLERDQCQLLAQDAKVVQTQSSTRRWLLKTVLPLAEPADVQVLIDADMIVTRSLSPLIERAAAGKVVAFAAGYERYVARWSELLELGPVARRDYLSSGLIFAGGGLAARVFEAMDERRELVESAIGPSPDESTDPDLAFVALDQDVFNAVLGALAADHEILAPEHRLAPDPPFEGLHRVGGRYRYADGVEPYVVHSVGRKPWQHRLAVNAYSRLLIDHLTSPGIALKPPDRALPLQLRRGALAEGARRAITVREGVGSLLRERLPSQLIDRVDQRRFRRGAGA